MFKKTHKEVGKPHVSNTHEEKPQWIEALEANDMKKFAQVLSDNDNLDVVFEGHLGGTLHVNGKWTPLGAACFFDNGSAVTWLLGAGADPYKLFHRQGVSFAPMQYCKEHDKNFGKMYKKKKKQNKKKKSHTLTAYAALNGNKQAVESVGKGH